MSRYQEDTETAGAPTAGDRPIALKTMHDVLGVDETTPYTWAARGVLPPHDGVVGRSRYWWESTIVEWHDQRRAELGGRAAA